MYCREHSRMVPRAEVEEKYFRGGQLKYLSVFGPSMLPILPASTCRPPVSSQYSEYEMYAILTLYSRV